MWNEIRINKKGWSSVELAVCFPVMVVMVLLFLLVIKLSLTSSELKHCSLDAAVNEMTWKYTFEKYLGSSKWLGIKDKRSKTEITKGDKNLGGSMVTAQTEGKINLFIPMVVTSKYIVKESLSMYLYDRPFDDGTNDGGNVWQMSALKRGSVIENAFGGNLGDKFETFDIYNENRDAIAMLSIDVTTKTYQNGDALYKRIITLVDKVACFEYAEDNGVQLDAKDIRNREVWVIVPIEAMTELQKSRYEDAAAYASARSIGMQLIEYQRKTD